MTDQRAAGTTPRRAMVVDDDPFQRDLVGELLHQAGLDVVGSVEDGAAALLVLDAGASHPDLIVADLDMSGMDGIELLRHLAHRDYRGQLILMSGASPGILATAGDLARVHGLRLLADLPKPFDSHALAVALEGLPGPDASPADGVAVEPPVRLSVEEVRSGMAAGCIDIHVQPKVTVTDRRVVGAEAFLRWRLPSGALLPPASVLPAAEEGGLLNQLTMAVFGQAVDWLAQWRRHGHDLRISVNLSTANLTTLALPDAMESVAVGAGVEPGVVTLEITQDGLVEDISAGMEVIGRLRLKGFGIAIDDYGTGYSSLGQLRNLPVTELKVDQSFVEGAHRNSALSEILGSSATLGRSLGLSVVAQGVETAEVMDLLSALGCDEAQGYVVARPMPPSEFLAWKARWESTWNVGAGRVLP